MCAACPHLDDQTDLPLNVASPGVAMAHAGNGHTAAPTWQALFGRGGFGRGRVGNCPETLAEDSGLAVFGPR